MTIPATGGVIHAQDLADDINANVVTPYNNVITWYSGYSPFNPPTDGSTTSGTYQSVSPAAPSLGPSSYPTSAATVYGVGSKIVASTLVSAWLSYATTMSHVRKVNFIKYYNPSGNYYNQTYGMSFAAAQASITDNSSTYGVSSGSTVTAAGLASLVSNLAAQVNTSYTNTLTYTETWCHTSCHSSYSARGRR